MTEQNNQEQNNPEKSVAQAQAASDNPDNGHSQNKNNDCNLEQVSKNIKDACETLESVAERIKEVDKAVQDNLEEIAGKTKDYVQFIRSLLLNLVGIITFVMLIFVIASWVLVTFYIEPEKLIVQIEQRKMLNESGLLLETKQGTFVLLPEGTQCIWKLEGEGMEEFKNFKVCKISD